MAIDSSLFTLEALIPLLPTVAIYIVDTKPHHVEALRTNPRRNSELK